IGSKVYPGHASLKAAGIIFPRGDKAQRILEGFTEGPTIKARNGARFLIVPTPDAPNVRRGETLTPAAVERQFGRKLRVVPIRNGNFALMMDFVKGSRRKGGGFQRKSVAMFFLVAAARIPKKLDDPNAIM